MRGSRPTSPADPLLAARPGQTVSLLGNEAIVRGALEAGVAFATGYPGTPSSEITDSFARLADAVGIAFRYAVNEKIALELAFAASLAGARSLVAMKHLGLTYAGDPLTTIPYVGAVAGLVIVSAADPSCLTSPNEQDQRHLGPMLHIPILDPPTPADAHRYTRLAFEISEASRLPVLLRPTTRLCHSRAPVEVGTLTPPTVAGFRRDPARFVPIPVNARRLRGEIDDRLAIVRERIAQANLIRRYGAGPRGILAAGVPAAVVADWLDETGIANDLALITVGAVFPLPEAELLAALDGIETVLVVEELSPFLEDTLAALCARHGRRIEILGKHTNHLPTPFEYTPDVIRRGISAAFAIGAAPAIATAAPAVPPRPPVLCSGCPHRSAYFAARAAFDADQLFFNDIGCYTLGYGPPLNTADALLCMGAGFSLAAGVARVTGQRTVGFLGDSTFFHSGLPALVDAIQSDANIVAVVLDNSVTAMTGFQDSPGVTIGANGPARRVSIPEVARALGAAHVERIDPDDLPASVAAFRRAREASGVSVVVVERPCPVFLAKAAPKPRALPVYRIDHDLCQHCGRESLSTRCHQCVTESYCRETARRRSAETAAKAALEPIAPCARACPVNLCIQGYTAHIAAGDYARAVELILERLPLPDSICRVCEHPCEAVCVRGENGNGVAINDLKRFAMDWAAEHPEVAYTPRSDADHGRRVAVIGAGPAGLAAAHELRVRGYGVCLFDAGDAPGGLLRTGIPAYRLPAESLQRDIDRILALGVEFTGNCRLGRDISVRELLDGDFDAVCLALGLGKPLSLPLETADSMGDAPPMLDALEFLRRHRHAPGDCRGQAVVVLGGGNSAIDAARTARRAGAESVTVVCLESREAMPAIESEVDGAECEGILVVSGMRAVRRASRALECIGVEPLVAGDFHPDRLRAVPDSARQLPADLVVVAIGQIPDRSAVAPGDVALDWTPEGFLATDPETAATSHANVFAAGDWAGRGGDVISAIADGQRMAWGVDCALRGREAANHRPPPPRPSPPTRRFTAPDGVTRAVPPARLPIERANDFGEVVGRLTEAEARAEAARCMSCGHCGNCRACIDTFGCPAFFVADGRIEIDPAQCIGCGVCADFCPNQAIHPMPSEGAPA